jgi:hypothetical protein
MQMRENIKVVKLSNGRSFFIEENIDTNSISFGLWDETYNDVDMYVGSITKDGVTVYPNSGHAVDTLSDFGLTDQSSTCD